MVFYLTNRFKRNKKKLSVNEQLRFIKRLYRLLKSGYSLIAALKMMQYDTGFKHKANKIKHLLMEGLTIDGAFDTVQFDSTIVSYLYFVRMNADLVTSFEKCINIFEQKIEYTNKLLRTLRYPIILIAIFIILLIVIKSIVLPSFLNLFQSNEQASSIVMHFILLIDYITSLFFILLIFICLLLFCFQFVKKKLPIETQLRIYERTPFIKRILKVKTTFFLATHMSMLLKTGMSLKQVLKNLASQQKMPIIAYYSSLMRNELINGRHFISLLRTLPFIKRPFVNLFEKSKDQAQLVKDLSSYANMLAEEVEHKLMKLIHMIQPTIFIILGCLIVLIYGSLLWPILEIIQSI